MDLLNSIISFFLWIYVHSPIYLGNEYIDSLQMTSNPDTYLTMPQVIARHGYPTETYTIPTPDGFLLELHRIPNDANQRGKNSTPMLLVHGYLDSSSAWIALGPGQALAYLLADQGYDVWMINTRGNTYSRGHTKYTTLEQEFWNFSFHEIGIYDLPATIDFILYKTNHDQVFCICDSVGNNVLFITLSVLPKYNEKIIALVSLAPIYHLASETITETSQNSIGNYVWNYLFWNTPGSWLERDLLTKVVIQILTSVSLFGYNGYDLLLYYAYGLSPYRINKEIMPAVYNTFPAGTSIKTTIHMEQFFDSAFTYFDYGSDENLKIYGNTSPPEYNISNIRIPTRMYHAIDDITSKPKDIQLLYDQLPQKEGLVTITDHGFTHLEFTWGKNAKEVVYDDVIAFVNYIQNTPSTT